MAEILVSGINRNGSTENATPNSASLVMNYRNDNGRWSEVGDKIYTGCVSQICKKYTWHYKLNVEKTDYFRDGNNYVIGYYEVETSFMGGQSTTIDGFVAIFDITAQYNIDNANINTDQHKTLLLDEDGETPFNIGIAHRLPPDPLSPTPQEWTIDDVFYDLYSFNDLLILETKKRTIYFYYDESTNNFVKLPDLADLRISVESANAQGNSDGSVNILYKKTPVNVPEIELGEESFGNQNAYRALLFPDGYTITEPFDVQNINSAEYIYAGFKVVNCSHPAFRCFSEIKQAITESLNMKATQKKERMLLGNDVLKAFRVVAVATLADGSVLNISNVVDFFDYERHSDTKDMFDYQKGTVVDFGQANIESDHGTYTQKDKYYNSFRTFHVDAGIYPAYTPAEPNRYYKYNNNVGKMTYKLYKNVYVSITSNIDAYYKWQEKNIIKDISVYCTDIIDLLDYNNIDILSAPRTTVETLNGGAMALNFGELIVNFFIPIKDIEDEFTTPFYKVGSLKFKDNESKMQIKGKMFAGITNKPVLSIDQIIGKRYVSNNNFLYNGIVHKCNTDSTKGNYTYGIYEDKGLYIDIQSKQYGWLRTPYLGSFQTLTTGVYKILFDNTCELQNASDIERINIVIRDPANQSQFKIVAENVKFFTDDNRNVAIILNASMSSSLVHSHTYSFRNLSDFPYWDGVNDRLVYIRNGEYDNPYDTIPDEPHEREYVDIRKNNPTQRYSTAQIAALTTVDYNAVNVNDINKRGLDSDTNVMQLSSTENPFIFPSARNYVFGEKDNIVIGCATSTQTLSDTKYGQLPLYVFCTKGVWVMETGQNEVAYASSHKISNIACYNAPKMILGTPYGVVFMTDEGLILIDTNNQFNNISLPLEGFMGVACSSEIDNIMRTNISDAAVYYENFIEYVSTDTFCVYDKRYKELLVINPEINFCFVYSFYAQGWYARCDMQVLKNDDGTEAQMITQYQRTVDINGEIYLISKGVDNVHHTPILPQQNFDAFSKITEKEWVKTTFNSLSGEQVIVTTPIFNEQYFKVEHLISRFYLICNEDDMEYDIGMFITGSRNGVEWKIVGKGILRENKNTINNMEIRRMICSCRYVQIVFVKRLRNLTFSSSNRLLNYFSRFSMNTSINDGDNKLR